MAAVSEKFNLNNWKLTLPVDSTGGVSGIALEVKNLIGFTDPLHFHLGADGAMIFDADVDGAKTSGTKYARSELRERAGDKDAAWTPAQGGTMTATLAIHSAPTTRDGTEGKMVIGQIHGKSDELVRLYYDNGHVYFVNDQAGPDNKETTFDLLDANGKTTDIDLNEKFSYKIEANAKTVTVTVYADGTTYSATSAVNSVWQNDSLYFKAGVYLGVNTDLAHGGATGTGEVAFYGLDYSHTAGQGLGGLLGVPTVSGLVLAGNDADDTLTGGNLNDLLSGNAGNDALFGGAGGDKLFGGEGNDRLDGGTGADAMTGGNGDDVYVVDNAGDAVTEALNGGIDTVESSVSYTLTPYVENLTLTGTDNINGTGNALDNVLTGNSGNNILNGSFGADTLQGGAGDDTYVVDNSSDQINEAAGEGKDLVISSVSYRLSNHVEQLTLTGTATIGIGNESNNLIIGNNQNNQLFGNGGNDKLDGGAGADAMDGGQGDDIYYVDNVKDTVIEGIDSGVDLVRSTVTFTLGANVENLTLISTLDKAAAGAYGNDLDNTIIGNSSSNIISGGLGNDVLTGSGGNDVFLFNTALNAGTNVDTITDFKTNHDDLALDHLIFGAMNVGVVNAKAFALGTSATTADQHIIFDQASGTLYYDEDGVGGKAQIEFAHLTPGSVIKAADFSII